ncbi:hypothetical protein E4U16_004409 [Claviceps sp. LM84 group G4]|nr:hypothetical protein E4U33_004182 [Claviceps sp. LM78 group G4]KAG6073836.1 hypothetical protein E4U16_004409 [Claviceps sp. LM84 group G4]
MLKNMSRDVPTAAWDVPDKNLQYKSREGTAVVPIPGDTFLGGYPLTKNGQNMRKTIAKCLRQWLGVAEKDESDLLKAEEEEALQDYQHVDIIGNNQEHGGILDGPEFDQEIEDDE